MPNMDYSSRKQSLQDVQRALIKRMLWSQEIHNNITDEVNKLTGVCDDLERWYTNGNSNATIAVGYLPGHLMIATQGFTFTRHLADIQDEVMQYYDFDPSRDVVHFITNTSLGLGNLTGLHAEMMIVRFLVVEQHISKHALSDRNLTIATSTSKGCCPNCAGWLNMYRIPHTVRRDNLSGLWRNPVTLNQYMHSTVDPFTHDPQVRYAGHANQAAEINRYGQVLRAPTGPFNQKTYNVPVTVPQSNAELNMILNVGGLLNPDDYD
jgi:hypothetical protein